MLIYLNNEKFLFKGISGESGEDLAKELLLVDPDQALALKINGQLHDLSHVLKENDEVSFVSFKDEDGKKVFWHTATHVLAQAVVRLWPEALATIGPAIEEGYYHDFANLNITEDDLGKIEEEMKKIIEENYKTVRVELKNKKEALEVFAKNPYTLELIKEIPEGEKLSYYMQGEYFQFCRGPHLLKLGKIKAFKLVKVSGAYWRGDSKNEMLTRIYGVAYPDKKMLQDYLKFQEEAKERDHKKLGQELDLYSFHEEAAGMGFFHPKGMYIWNVLIDYMREVLEEEKYVEIRTPLILNKDLWIRSGHWGYYRNNMYTFEIEKGDVAIKPMNCPGCMIYYKTSTHSYREFPLRIAEIGLVHRQEASGALNGLFRVRSFHQDDAHIFIRPLDLKDEILGLLKLVDKIYKVFGLSYHLELSTRPAKEKTIGTDEDWDMATNGLKEALDEYGASYKINEGDGAFYGPKIDIHIKDALQRTWQTATIQLDLNLPDRFDLSYIDQDGKHKRPIMLHRTIYGGIERFLAILVEHFGGRFPLWLSPLAARVIIVADRHEEYGRSIVKKLKRAGFKADIDFSSESVSKKIRNAQLLKINYMLTIGDKEVETNTVSIRTRDGLKLNEIPLDDFMEKISKEREEKSLVSSFTS